MKTIRGPRGEERLWFEANEIEQMMESELRKASLMPNPADPAVDLERFVEKHLRAVLVQYATLDPSILGVTEFFLGKPPRISINKDLTGSALDEDDTPPGVLGRWRATLAHEAAHVLLHRMLYEFAAANMNLFSREPTSEAGQRLHRCPKRAASYGAVSDWREVQANQGMAALLMPKGLFVAATRAEIAGCYPGHDKIPAGQEERIAARLASRFKVSKQAARIRLTTLGCVSAQGQQQF